MNGRRLRAWLPVIAGGESLISTAGGVLLAQTARLSDLNRGLSKGLQPWHLPLAVHDPGKIVLDLAMAIAFGGDCAADIALVRAQPQVFGPVASDPTVSRLIARLAEDADAAVAAICAARAQARARVWRHAGVPRQDGLVVIDLDATLITAHSDKEWAAPTFKRGFGFHPLLSHADHGQTGTGEPLAGMLRTGNAGSNTAADHIAVFDDALAQLPADVTAADTAGGRAILVRTDAAGATHDFARHLHEQGVQFSLGAYLHHFDILAILAELPAQAWHCAADADHKPRDGAWVAEATAYADLSAWPTGTRLILRKERPHPGAQLRITDADGNRVTGFLTYCTGKKLAALELRHRRHARVEDRIRAAKDTGLANLPFHDAAANRIWLEVSLLAADLLAHLQRLALDGTLRLAEPKRLRLRLFSVAGRLIRSARRHVLRIPKTWPWAEAITTAHQRQAALAPP